jgi:hypothetical protein
VGEGVPELVGVDVADARLFRPAVQHHLQGLEFQRPEPTEPEFGPVGVGMASPGTEVVAQGLSGLQPERCRSGAPALTHDHGDVLLKVEVVDLDRHEFGAADAAVEQHPDHRGVADFGTASLARRR